MNCAVDLSCQRITSTDISCGLTIHTDFELMCLPLLLPILKLQMFLYIHVGTVLEIVCSWYMLLCHFILLTSSKALVCTCLISVSSRSVLILSTCIEMWAKMFVVLYKLFIFFWLPNYICTGMNIHQILFRWPNQEEWDGLGMWHIFETGEVHTGFQCVRLEGQRAIGKLSHRWEDNIKMGVKEVGWGGGCIDWVDLPRDRDSLKCLTHKVKAPLSFERSVSAHTVSRPRRRNRR